MEYKIQLLSLKYFLNVIGTLLNHELKTIVMEDAAKLNLIKVLKSIYFHMDSALFTV